MVQSWNKMCFKGGRLEASISLPGRGDTVGFWPGFWSMGNLGRPGYASTTDGLWPYSYENTCDAGITANQSSPDGINYLPGMRLPSCTCNGEDHPTQGTSRSAPEIDALEASVGFLDSIGNEIGTVSQSFSGCSVRHLVSAELRFCGGLRLFSDDYERLQRWYFPTMSVWLDKSQ